MALVCDIKSNQSSSLSGQPEPTDNSAQPEDDLEDGEIEDDEDEEEVAGETQPSSQASLGGKSDVVKDVSNKQQQSPQHSQMQLQQNAINVNPVGGVGPPGVGGGLQNVRAGLTDKQLRIDREREGRAGRNRHEDKKKMHMTEAEKSVMYLHGLERLEREKRDKFRREQGLDLDDFASNIEKAIANVLKKENRGQDPEDDFTKIDEVKRGKKRKKKDKERKKNKHHKLESPRVEGDEEFDENEMLNIRGGSPDGTNRGGEEGPPRNNQNKNRDRTHDSENTDDYESGGESSEYLSDRSMNDERRMEGNNKRRGGDFHGNKNKGGRSRRDKMSRDRKFQRDRSREKRQEAQMRDAQNVCLYNLQGKCHKGDDCQYSHDMMPPMKLELCKFYLMDCCAKGDKCLYMHSEFPCKYYHTGLQCYAGENCKFAHGKPLSENLRQVLFKHIETAPKEILGDFPRLSREGAAQRITQTQKNLEVKYNMERKDSMLEGNLDGYLLDMNKDKNLMGEKPRVRQSRWQDPDPINMQQGQQSQDRNVMGMNFATGMYLERLDQDMRISSNGDVDMRTLPPIPIHHNVNQNQKVDVEQYKRDAAMMQTDFTKDTDIRNLQHGFATSNVNPLHQQMEMQTQQELPPPAMENTFKDIDIRMPFSHLIPPPNMQGPPPMSPISQIPMVQPQVPTQTDNFDSSEKIAAQGETEVSLPPKQRELFMRIQAQQKDSNESQQAMNETEEQEQTQQSDAEENINWYSDDDDDLKLTIKVDDEQVQKDEHSASDKNDSDNIMSPPSATSGNSGTNIMNKLGDLSKIDIPAEMSQLLNQISQASATNTTSAVSNASTGSSSATVKQLEITSPTASTKVSRDPRSQSQILQDVSKMDPRLNRRPSHDADLSSRLSSSKLADDSHGLKSSKVEKISIYEQGSISMDSGKDVDLRGGSSGDLDLRLGVSPTGRPDVDLRNLGLGFKSMQNYTPATEIDASIKSHNPIHWKVAIVEIPKPDYTGLKLSAQDAQTTGDPRLRKIFRLSSIDEKDSPASPKESANTGNIKSGLSALPRIDPRRRKMEEASGKLSGTGNVEGGNMSYAQQLNTLQSSVFYQSLTSSQKLLLNQELSTRNDQSGTNDPILNGILSNLGLIQLTGQQAVNQGSLSILANVNNLTSSMMPGQNPMMSGNPNMMSGNQSMMPGNQNMMPGNQNMMPGNQNMLSGNQSMMSGNQNMLPGNQNMLPGNQNMLPGNQNMLPGNQNMLPGNQNMMSGNQNMMSGNPNSMMSGNPMMSNQNPMMGNQNSMNPMMGGPNQGSMMPGNPQNQMMGNNPNLMNQMAQSISQPGLLGAAPGIPNLPPDFQINFDPRNGGLLGNAPSYSNYPQQDNFNNYDNDFYEQNQGGNFSGNNSGGGGGGGRGGGGDRGGYRERNNRRGGRNNFNRNGNRNFNSRNNRNNRSNRSHSPS